MRQTVFRKDGDSAPRQLFNNQPRSEQRFVDNRPVNAAQFKLNDSVSRSKIVASQLARGNLVNEGSQKNFPIAQRVETKNQPVQRVTVRENPEVSGAGSEGQHAEEEQEEPIQGKFSYSGKGASSSQSPVQLVRLAGEDTLQTNLTITGHDHNRASVHAWAKDRAFNLGPFRLKATGSVCNHHWAYTGIQAEFLAQNVLNETVSDAANKTLITYGSLNLLTGMTSAHKNTMIRARDKTTVSRNAFDKALNYCIMKICDYPGNLFYWPTKTDTEPDNPRYSYNDGDVPNGWDFANYVTTATEGQVLADEKERIKEGREELETAVA